MMRTAMTGVTVAGRGMARSLTWWAAHWRPSLGLLALLAALWLSGHHALAVTVLVVAVTPGAAGAAWCAAWPVSFERWWAGPVRRRGWRRWARSTWPAFAQRAGLTVTETTEHRSRWNGETSVVRVVHAPALVGVAADGERLQVTARARLGQTAEALEAVAPALRDAASARSVRAVQAGPGTVRFDLVMRDLLAAPTPATFPEAVSVDHARLGLREDGDPFDLRITGRHTLIAGASGSGKGSMFWGVALSLAPAVHAGVAQLLAIDLKYGMEAAIGAPLFSTVATTEAQAVAVLQHAEHVVRERGRRLAGHTRQHEPVKGDPLVLVMIDELAVLTAYMTDKALAKEADRCLRVVLTQGRALGVLVVGALQDPRKEALPQRGLFTQTVALRLRSAEETRMVLGDGVAQKAPADRIPGGMPGLGYVMDEDGSTIRVRAAYASDAHIRKVTAHYRTPLVLDLPDPTAAAPEGSTGRDTGADTGKPPTGGGRKPRKPRQPRPPRAPRPTTDDGDGEVA